MKVHVVFYYVEFILALLKRCTHSWWLFLWHPPLQLRLNYYSIGASLIENWTIVVIYWKFLPTSWSSLPWMLFLSFSLKVSLGFGCWEQVIDFCTLLLAQLILTILHLSFLTNSPTFHLKMFLIVLTNCTLFLICRAFPLNGLLLSLSSLRSTYMESLPPCPITSS